MISRKALSIGRDVAGIAPIIGVGEVLTIRGERFCDEFAEEGRGYANIIIYIQQGIKQLFCTDVSKDGKLEGPANDLYKSIVEKFPGLHFIASGGVSSAKDLEELERIGCKGVIVGKAIYENRVSLNDLEMFNIQ